jgi:hypothetical protein
MRDRTRPTWDVARSSGNLASVASMGGNEHQGRKRRASPWQHGHDTAAHGARRRYSQNGRSYGAQGRTESTRR